MQKDRWPQQHQNAEATEIGKMFKPLRWEVTKKQFGCTCGLDDQFFHSLSHGWSFNQSIQLRALLDLATCRLDNRCFHRLTHIRIRRGLDQFILLHDLTMPPLHDWCFHRVGNTQSLRPLSLLHDFLLATTSPLLHHRRYKFHCVSINQNFLLGMRLCPRTQLGFAPLTRRYEWF